jgi:hypothetical protein
MDSGGGDDHGPHFIPPVHPSSNRAMDSHIHPIARSSSRKGTGAGPPCPLANRTPLQSAANRLVN